MWKPADKSALPSPEDRILAKRAIQQLQVALTKALYRLPASDPHVRSMTRELDERRAWLAPIRQMPWELLSAVFVMAAEEEWRSPVRIASVCRLWRDVAIETPYAWSFMNLCDRPSLDTAYLFFLRSGRSLLHLTVLGPPEPAEYTSLASSISHRLECLSIRRGAMDMLLEDFENLTQLSVGDKLTRIPLDYLDITRFPNLRYIHAAFEKGTSSGKSPPYPRFPRIERLVAITDRDLAWIDALIACAKTLTSLHISVGKEEREEQAKSVDLPRLRNLQIDTVDFSPRTWGFKAKTPMLQTYSVGFQNRVCNVSIDVATITHFRCHDLMPLCQYPKLLQVHVVALPHCRWPTLHIIDELRRDFGACINLESVVVNNWDMLDTRQITRNLRRRNRTTGVDLEVYSAKNPKMSWPGEIYVSCGKGMPCYTSSLGLRFHGALHS